MAEAGWHVAFHSAKAAKTAGTSTGIYVIVNGHLRSRIASCLPCRPGPPKALFAACPT